MLGTRAQKQREIRYNKALMNNSKTRLKKIVEACFKGLPQEQEMETRGQGAASSSSSSAEQQQELLRGSSRDTDRGPKHARLDIMNLPTLEKGEKGYIPRTRLPRNSIEIVDEGIQQLQGQIQENYQRQDKLLDEVQGVVVDLKQKATVIGSEIDATQIALDAVEKKIGEASDTLQTLNARMKKYIDGHLKPHNCVINFACVLLLLGLIGLLLDKLPINL